MVLSDLDGCYWVICLDENTQTADFYHLAQAQRCKELHFGHGAPTDEHHQSQIVMTLQSLGHRLPDIWQVLR
ncbi:TPA: hypothetical protein I6209_003686 [Vibrio cholerae]|nr:hypothetical protein [Vibrio cholerae]